MATTTALKTAAESLRSCYSEQGIYAGLHHFDDYWTRDFCFSSLGAVRLGDFDIVRKHLELLLRSAKGSGQLPFRIGDNSFKQILKFINVKSKSKKLAPLFSEDKSRAFPVDQNSLFIIAFFDYVRNSGDKKFLAENFEKLKMIVDWNQSQEKEGLISEKPYGNWADSIKKSGKVLFTNVCYYKALADFAELCKLAKKDGRVYEDKAKNVKKEINRLFWNGKYYSDWIGRKRYDFFSADGNLLAVLWEVADKKQALSIVGCADEFKIGFPVPSKTNYPAYPWFIESMQMVFCFNKGYHNQSSWLWLGCVQALAQLKAGQKKAAQDTLSAIAKKIEEYGKVYELYDQKGRPWKKLIYTAEVPFAWNSGMFIYASKELEK